jgi:hypothetical protein
MQQGAIRTTQGRELKFTIESRLVDTADRLHKPVAQLDISEIEEQIHKLPHGNYQVSVQAMNGAESSWSIRITPNTPKQWAADTLPRILFFDYRRIELMAYDISGTDKVSGTDKGF